MNKLSSVVMAAAAVGVLATIPEAAIAAPITYDFTGAVVGDQALGGSHTYTAIGGPNLTAISGSYSHSGTGAPSVGDAFTTGGQLVGNNRGADEMGVGVCFGNGCNNGHINDAPVIDASGREAIRLDISALLAGFSGFTINVDSATDGELLGVFASNAAGTALGAKLADITSANGNVPITPTSNYLFFVADNTTTSGAEQNSTVPQNERIEFLVLARRSPSQRYCRPDHRPQSERQQQDHDQRWSDVLQ